MLAEAKEMGVSWEELERPAEDKVKWRSMIAALCPTGDDED